MRVLVSGAGGLVGCALVERLQEAGDEVLRLSRSPGQNTVVWDPAAGVLPADDLAGVDAVVNLAGESIMGLWTSAKKARIRDSRVRGTDLLSRALASLPAPPRVLVNASAVGYYGARGAEVCYESTTRGAGFLADVGQAWEAAAQPARDASIRVVPVRIGMVLSTAGGALATMLPPFRLGLGGRVGSGRQYMSWISLDDLVGVIDHALRHDDVTGPVNAVSGALTNAEFTRVLGRVLRRPTVVPLPAFAVRLLMGQMGQALLLASTRVEPAVLRERGFAFTDASLDAALERLLRD